MRAENRSDELWIGVKGQSNQVIAGSFRNSFRASLTQVAHGGRALTVRGSLPGYQQLSNSEYRMCQQGSETVGAKLHSRKGNSPDRQLRSLIRTKWIEGGGIA